MPPLFEELDYQPTEIGALSLRRRFDPLLNEEVYEIKLGEDFLMTSSFTASEIALAELGLAAATGEKLQVLVGGLGLGYTAEAVLKSDRVKKMVVLDALPTIVEWHENGLLPLGKTLTADPRCHFVIGDFFALAQSTDGFEADRPGQQFDAILVDIDHSPDFLLDPQNASFYAPEGLRKLARHLTPGGVFGLWSNDPPDAAFVARLSAAFADAWVETVVFHNPIQKQDFTQSVYLARAE